VRGPFERLAETEIGDAIVRGWALSVDELRYVPEGGGAHHWIALGTDGRPWFVTCDDLDTKPWLGSDRDTVFDGLLSAYGTAMDLRHAGLSFVAAPIATTSGDPARRVDERHSVALFEYVAGEPGRWGERLASRARVDPVAMLAALHRSTVAPRAIARRGLEVPGRAALEEALEALDSPWNAGPLSELTRRELTIHVDAVVGGLTVLDRFAAQPARSEDVVTHGEPHPGNLIRTSAGLVLVDWDTVAVARPERDLWMIAGVDASAVTRYRSLTGLAIDHDALSAYRLLWALTDIAAFTVELRGEHCDDVDTRRALVGLRSILGGAEPLPYATATASSR
jgi:spectinomycin phosphotransferase